MNGHLDIKLKDQRLTLLPQRAVFWHEHQMLIVADPHFGKAAVFRRSGIALPKGMTADDLDRLEKALAAVRASTVLFLGDLMHSRVTDTDVLDRIKVWRDARNGLQVILVRGNHDRWVKSSSSVFGINSTFDMLDLPPFTFRHEPAAVHGSYVISGHLHPGVRMAGIGRQTERLPCFYFGQDYAVLPSFGSFTGNVALRPKRGDRVFGIVEDIITEL